jgi:hypothetical protein
VVSVGALPIYIVLVFAGVMYNGIGAFLSLIMGFIAFGPTKRLTSDHESLDIFRMEILLGTLDHAIYEALLPRWNDLFRWLHR